MYFLVTYPTEMMVPTLAGTELTVSLTDGMVQIDNANVSVARY